MSVLRESVCEKISVLDSLIEEARKSGDSALVEKYESEKRSLVKQLSDLGAKSGNVIVDSFKNKLPLCG